MFIKLADKLKSLYDWLQFQTYVAPDRKYQCWVFRPNENEIFGIDYEADDKMYFLRYYHDNGSKYKYSSPEQFVIIDLVKIILYS